MWSSKFKFVVFKYYYYYYYYERIGAKSQAKTFFDSARGR